MSNFIYFNICVFFSTLILVCAEDVNTARIGLPVVSVKRTTQKTEKMSLLCQQAHRLSKSDAYHFVEADFDELSMALREVQPTPTMDQCFSLFSEWKKRYQHNQHHNVWEGKSYNTWVEWLLENPRDVMYLFSINFVAGIPENWQWLQYLVDQSSLVQEEEADISPLVDSYTNGFYCELPREDIWRAVFNILDRIKGDMAPLIGSLSRKGTHYEMPVCDTSFIQKCASLHLVYQRFALYEDVSTDWWSWVMNNPARVGVALRVESSAVFRERCLLKNFFKGDMVIKFERVDAYFTRTGSSRGPSTARATLADFAGAENHQPIGVHKAKGDPRLLDSNVLNRPKARKALDIKCAQTSGI